MYILAGRELGEAPSCSSTNCSAICSGIPAARFDKQPADLQRVLKKSSKYPEGWLGKLDPESCLALASIFNRMCRYRLWCHVDRVLKIVAGEAPLRAAGHTIAVPGSTPSVYFLSPSGTALLQALMATGRFCIAGGIGASLHPHQHTLREISGSDSLHISIGPGNYFDAHIDKYSPVPEHPGSINCPNDVSVAALRHIGSEAVPEIVRKKTGKIVRKIVGKKAGIPGVQLFPDFELTPNMPRPEPATRQEANLPPPPVGITWRF
jgi:hypothetical protein